MPSLFSALQSVLRRWFGPPSGQTVAVADYSAEQVAESGSPLQIEEHDGSLTHLVPYDENLLERSRTQWQFGDWESLAQLSRDTLQHHPDRAKLALLAAAGLLQTGETEAARQYIRLAQDWGVSKKLISQILIAGVHNSLGRAAAVGGQEQRALGHFERAVVTGMPGSDVRLITQSRTREQFGQISLKQKLQLFKNTDDIEGITDACSQENKHEGLIFCPESYAYYQELSQKCIQGKSVPFILIDSKSLPRSGLHYLKNTFSKLLGEHFSFCEWYQEPGCCKKMPCAITGYAEHTQRTQTVRLRLIKSHDLELSDPVFDPIYCIRRVILVREPLFILTSWFALDQLDRYKMELKKQGINMEKIWLSHEPELLEVAYKIVDGYFDDVSVSELEAWLNKKSRYIIDFNKKWVEPTVKYPKPFVEIVNYEEINSYIVDIASEIKKHMSDSVQNEIDKFDRDKRKKFYARQDPFKTNSDRISDFLMKNSSLFKNAALVIRDKTTIL